MRYIVFLFILAGAVSCGDQPSVTIESPKVSVDSLRSIFLAGWNNRDSAAIMATIAENGIVMNDSLIHKGHGEIAGRWVSGGVKVLSNIRTESMISDSDGSIAHDAGTYTLDLTPPGGPLLKERGNYNLVWKRQQGGEWKLTLVHIEDITRMPDVRP